MKANINFFVTLLLWSGIGFGQEPLCHYEEYKALNDSAFEIGDKILSPEIIFGGSCLCDIYGDEENMFLIQSFLIRNPKLIIEIGAHTDSRGSAEANERISQIRARNVCEWLKSHGIEPDRITPKGYGETQLLKSDKLINGLNSKEDREAFHKCNRRIILTILNKVD